MWIKKEGGTGHTRRQARIVGEGVLCGVGGHGWVGVGGQRHKKASGVCPFQVSQRRGGKDWEENQTIHFKEKRRKAVAFVGGACVPGARRAVGKRDACVCVCVCTKGPGEKLPNNNTKRKINKHTNNTTQGRQKGCVAGRVGRGRVPMQRTRALEGWTSFRRGARRVLPSFPAARPASSCSFLSS